MKSSKIKRNICLIFGGRSGEHEVSLMSARSVLSVLDQNKYNVFEIGITHDGVWLTGEDTLAAFEQGKTNNLLPVTLSPDPTKNGHLVNGQLINIDVYFPVIHGTFGEDGTLQGLFEMADVAYVGSGVLGSAVGMDKGVFKYVMASNNIPIVKSTIVLRSEIEHNLKDVINKIQELGSYPLFIKPANLGSSVGITKCRSQEDVIEGLMEAAQYDRRVLIEHGVPNPREIEISVLGNDQPVASVLGEIFPGADFYSYDAKYFLDSSTSCIPAVLSNEITLLVKDYAIRAFKAIDCFGMARVDFLLDSKSGEIFLNEINTIPGFTKISMYPKLWEASGLPYENLINKLIELALERKADRDHTIHQFKRYQ